MIALIMGATTDKHQTPSYCRHEPGSGRYGRRVPADVVPRTDSRLLHAPGLLLGVGLGGFVDGIVLHQLLQWHHVLSTTGRDRLGLPEYPVDTVAGLRVNTLWDGLFHVLAWVATAAGLVVLVRRVSPPRTRVLRARALWGRVLAGWGAFDVVEGLAAHQLLGIHHVRPGPHEVAYDVGYLLFGAALWVLGSALARAGGSTVGPSTTASR